MSWKKVFPEVCKAHGIKPEELGVKGCLLIYRRREQDMPLAQPPDNATPEQVRQNGNWFGRKCCA